MTDLCTFNAFFSKPVVPWEHLLYLPIVRQSLRGADEIKLVYARRKPLERDLNTSHEKEYGCSLASFSLQIITFDRRCKKWKLVS